MPRCHRLRSLVPACVAVALVGGCALPLASEGELELQGATEFQKLKRSTPLVTDAATRAYVNCVAGAIVRVLEQPYAGKSWDVEVFDSAEVNAFALPGGHIGVYRGLLDVAENDDQLATVIGHEVAHVTRRHALQRYDRELTTQAGVLVGTIALGGGELAADTLGIAARYGLSLPFDRAQESEADLLGLDYMAAAGFNPTQAAPLWQNMQKQAQSSPPAFMSTHPSSATRIQELMAHYPQALQRYNKARTTGSNPQCRR